MTADLTADIATRPGAHLPSHLVAESIRLLNRGTVLAQQRNSEQAIACFNQAIRLSSTLTPKSETPRSRTNTQSATLNDRQTATTIAAKAYYHRACTFGRIDCYAQAITDFSFLIQQTSTQPNCSPWVRAKLAEIYIHRGNAHRRLGHHPQALQDLNEGVERTEGSAQSYSCRGLLKLDTEDFSGAIADFTQALTDHPTFAQGYLWRGFAQLRSGQPANALTDLTRAIEAIPTCAEAYNHRGVAHVQLNQLALALRDFEQAIRLKGDFAEAHNNRGNLWQMMGDKGNAIADYDRAIALAPHIAEFHANRLTTSASLDDTAEHYNTPIDLPNDASFYRHRAQVCEQQNQWHAAIADYATALAISPTAYAHHHRGKAFLQVGEVEQALTDFDCAIALLPDYAQVYCDRAPLRFHVHDAEGALTDIHQALTLCSNIPPEIHATRCLAHFCVGDRTRALQDFETLVDRIEAAHSSSSHTSKDATSIGSSAVG